MKNMANILQKVIHIFIKISNFFMIYDYYKIMFIFIYMYIQISNIFSSNNLFLLFCLVMNLFLYFSHETL